jgi:hypothetical protein
VYVCMEVKILLCLHSASFVTNIFTFSSIFLRWHASNMLLNHYLNDIKLIFALFGLLSRLSNKKVTLQTSSIIIRNAHIGLTLKTTTCFFKKHFIDISCTTCTLQKHSEFTRPYDIHTIFFREVKFAQCELLFYFFIYIYNK